MRIEEPDEFAAGVSGGTEDCGALHPEEYTHMQTVCVMGRFERRVRCPRERWTSVFGEFPISPHVKRFVRLLGGIRAFLDPTFKEQVHDLANLA